MGDIPIGKLKTTLNIPMQQKKDDIHVARSVDSGRVFLLLYLQLQRKLHLILLE